MPDDPKLADILVREGFVANEYLLEINHSLNARWGDSEVAYPWNLPSRLMQFPLEVQTDADGQLRIGLMHPQLAMHPFVLEVAKAIEPHTIALDGAPNAAGYTQVETATWWHAVDLIADHWQDLLTTRQFTTDDCIVRAVTYALDYNKWALTGIEAAAMASNILAEVPAPAPVVDGETVLSWLQAPVETTPDKGAPYWAVQARWLPDSDVSAASLAWARIWGLEAGWFGYPRRASLLQWSAYGRESWDAVNEAAAEAGATAAAGPRLGAEAGVPSRRPLEPTPGPRRGQGRSRKTRQ